MDGRSRTYPQHYLRGTGYKAYRSAIEDVLIPGLKKFNPDLILISSGFDAANHDVGNAKHVAGGKERIGINLMPEDYAWTTEKIVEVADQCCGGRVISVLEGGYGRTEANKSQTRSSAAAAPLPPASPEALVEQKNRVSLDRSYFAECAAAHLQSLIDAYADNYGEEDEEEQQGGGGIAEGGGGGDAA